MTDYSQNSSASSAGLKPPKSIGRYRVLGRIGHGGMATVYLGRSAGPVGFERLVAIKLLHEHLSSEKKVVEMFMEEAKVAARIRHPNVVPVIEVGETRGRHFLVMEYIHGESLLTVIARSWKTTQSFPSLIAAYLMIGASDGLHAAHELLGQNGELLGVVHRDVSPHNFLVGYDGVVRISDFGIVKIQHEIRHTQSGVKGKVAYMAPEQALGKAVDRRTDLFALGTVMWEMLSGRRLFKGATDFTTLQNVCSRLIPPPSMYAPGLAKELDRITLRLLQRDSKDRYATALEVSQDLRKFLFESNQSMFAQDITRFITTLCSDRMAQKKEMEVRFQREEHYDAEQLFDEGSEDGLLETIQEEVEDETPSQTEARELQREIKQRLQEIYKASPTGVDDQPTINDTIAAALQPEGHPESKPDEEIDPTKRIVVPSYEAFDRQSPIIGAFSEAVDGTDGEDFLRQDPDEAELRSITRATSYWRGLVYAGLLGLILILSSVLLWPEASSEQAQKTIVPKTRRVKQAAPPLLDQNDKTLAPKKKKPEQADSKDIASELDTVNNSDESRLQPAPAENTPRTRPVSPKKSKRSRKQPVKRVVSPKTPAPKPVKKDQKTNTLFSGDDL